MGGCERRGGAEEWVGERKVKETGGGRERKKRREGVDEKGKEEGRGERKI